MRPAPPYLLRHMSPLGRIELGATDHALVSLSIEHEGSLPHDGVPESGTAVLREAATQLDEYFSRSRTEFSVPVTLTGTDFRRQIWQQLSRVPWGSSTSYGALGAAAGRAGAGRPIGGAVAANPVPIIIGCHRVLAADGRITGYSAGAGVATKAWLLDHEGIAHR